MTPAVSYTIQHAQNLNSAQIFRYFSINERAKTTVYIFLSDDVVVVVLLA